MADGDFRNDSRNGFDAGLTSTAGSAAFADRVPPHDDDAEMAVLGGMLMSNDAIGEVSQMIEVRDFYQPKHQTIYEAIINLFSSSQPVDAVLVANELLKNGDLEKVGGVDYLHSLVVSVPTAANATYYAQIVHQRAVLRNVIVTGTKIAQLGYSAEGSQAEEVVNLAQSEVYEMSVGKVRQDYTAIGPVVQETLDQLDSLQKGELEKGVPTGFRDIDEVTQGLQPGQMIVVAGRPAMGKSTLGVDFARSAALHHNMTSIIFSLEMSKVELAQRIISAETNIPLTAMRRADDITPERWNTLNNFWNSMQGAPLYIDDSPNMSLMEIRAKCRRLKQTNDLKLVVIDYLQLMSSGKQEESRQQEVSGFSRALKLLAKELEVPVVALSQLNRGPEMRNDKKPQLSDLRESGSIEQDADVVFLVHRPDAYDKEDRPGEADIIMAKHRNGPTETFNLAFLGSTSKFKDMPQQDYNNQGV
ncbi:replicative DNA helicase [Bifidobacterium bohemicum]|uniref:Replicative DNA helicase n=1 Tax=Bifidobacterium bohemicum DSM 22767 TaxID=1437606 RepID=A0A086ZF47_9BIFI|nr:replicative DNA helicase [Bifidobacterium bohemicum]KFI45147.1 replicative DNA helicase [Bifidobacterium bohemicum DSM 22767]SCB90421.1 replicative DNA helicase [Bifidobacterium bohemicum]